MYFVSMIIDLFCLCKNCIISKWFIQEFVDKSQAFRNLNCIIPFNKLNNGYFGFKKGQLLANATPWSSTKANQDVRI